MDILTYINKMNRLYGNTDPEKYRGEPKVWPDDYKGQVLEDATGEYRGVPRNWNQTMPVLPGKLPLPKTMDLNAGGRVYDTRKYFKPGGLVEPGVTQLVQPNLDGSRPGYGGLPLTKQFPKLEERAIELLNQGLPMDEVSNTLETEGIVKIKSQPRTGPRTGPDVMKKNYSPFNNFYKRLLKDKKLNITEIATKISGVPFSKEVWLQRENAVIEAFKKNPNLSAHQISKLVSTELGQHVSYTAVANALRRAGIDYQGRDQKLLPDIKKLDKIIKNNTAFLSTKGSTKDKVKFLFEEFKKVTKNKNLDMDTFSYRLDRVGNLYAGTGVDRTVKKIYKSIKAPKNYIESGLHRNMVGMLDQFTRGIVAKAQLLGLPQKDIDLLSDVTKGAKSLSKISMAGDHTDIDGLMKNFSNYRKNFMRINMISHQLNAFKSASDKAIIKLHDEAVALRKSNHPNVAIRRKEILEEIATIRKNFKTKTGLNIGRFEFDAKGNPIMEKFETQRLSDLQNPRNKALLNAMNNLVKQSGVKFKGLDQELMFANTIKERFNILKNAGIDQLKNSKYIKAFAQMSGDVGKHANTILKTRTGKIGAGVGIYSLLSSIASASEKDEKGEIDVDEVTKAETIDAKTASAYAAAPLLTKTGRKIYSNVAKTTLKTLGKIAATAFGPTGIAAIEYFVGPGAEVRAPGTKGVADWMEVPPEGRSAKDVALDPISYMGVPLMGAAAKGTETATSGIRNKLIKDITQRALNLTLKPSTIMRIAGVTTPLSLAAIGGTTLYKIHQTAKEIAENPELLERARQVNLKMEAGMTEESRPDEPMFNTGGRVSFKLGGIDKGRRGFLKLLSALGITAAGIKTGLLKLANLSEAQVAKITEVIMEKAKGMPDWFPILVNRVVKEGDNVTKKLGTVEREIVHTKKISPTEEVTVYQDLSTGNVRVEYGPPVMDKKGNIIRAQNDNQVVHLEYKAPEVIDEGRHAGKKTNPEFSAAEAKPRVTNWEGDIEWEHMDIDKNVDDLLTDTSKLKTFAKKKLTHKDKVIAKKKQKYHKKLQEDPSEQLEYIEKKEGATIDDLLDEGKAVGEFDPKGYDPTNEVKGMNLPERKVKKASGGSVDYDNYLPDIEDID